MQNEKGVPSRWKVYFSALSLSSADEKRIRHSLERGNPGWRSCHLVLDTHVRGYDVSLPDDVRDSAYFSAFSPHFGWAGLGKASGIDIDRFFSALQRWNQSRVEFRLQIMH